MLYVPVDNFSDKSERFPVFLGLTSSKQRIKCLAEGHNTVTPVCLNITCNSLLTCIMNVGCSSLSTFLYVCSGFQPAHACRLISAFVFRILESIIMCTC